jgi:xylulokinase
MVEKLVIGIDCSTTAVKAIAWDRAGRAVAEGRAAYPILRPQTGWYEQDTAQWWTGTCTALRALTGQIQPEQIEGLCITHQRESFVPVDRQGQPLRNAILWLDARSQKEVHQLITHFGWQFLRDTTGKPPSMTPALPKLAWLAAHAPEIFRQAAWFLDTHAFLVQRLTGNLCTSLASADPLGLLDMPAGRWSADVLAWLGLREDQLPALVPPGSPVGVVNRAGAAATGLPEGLPVVAGAGDGQCAGLGAGVVAAGEAYLNMGTAVVSGAASAAYCTSDAFRTLYAPWQGGYYLETLLRGGVFLVSWFIETFAMDLHGHPVKSVETILEEQIAAIPPGSQGLMLVPYWVGVMNPHWDPSAAGITLGWTGDHRREHLYRAIFEGVAFEQRLAGDGVMAAIGKPFRAYRTVGGGSRSQVWCQMIADVTGVVVERSASVEATCLGAGILAAAAAGWYGSTRQAAEAMTGIRDRFLPDEARREVYDRLYREVYQNVFPAMRPLVDRLSELCNQGDSGNQ